MKNKNTAHLTLVCVLLRVRVLRSLCPHRLLPATSSFDDGHELPATEGARRCSLSFECAHRGFESCEGDLERHPRKGRFWLVRRDPDDDCGVFLPIPCDGWLTAHLYSGILGQSARLRRARAQLRRDL